MRHEKPGLIGLVPRQACSSLQYENRGLPLGQEAVAGGDVTLHGEQLAQLLARLTSLAPHAELRAISAVRNHAREAITLGDANWREIRCGITLVAGSEEQVIWPLPDTTSAKKAAAESTATFAAEKSESGFSPRSSAQTAAQRAPVLRVRISVSGVATRSLGSDALAGAAAALTTLATHCPGAQIGDLRIHAIDIEGRARFVHPCPLPGDVSALLPAEKPALANARCAVITLSDRASQGIYEDQSGERLAQIIAAQGGVLARKTVLPDDEGPLAGELLMLSRRGDIDLVICTGGTGIGPRDITPETIMALGMRPIPGVGELLRAHSAHIVRSAWLSRAVAGTLGPMIVIALPGNHKAVTECMEALLPLLPHTLAMLRGGGHDAH